MWAVSHTINDAVAVVRTLIVALGGFCTVAATLLALWYLVPLRHKTTSGEPRLATLMLGFLMLSYAGLAALTTDHIYKHLIANDAPAWQLWTALLTFTSGVITLIFLIAVRVDRKVAR